VRIELTVTFDSTRLEWQDKGAYVSGNTATHPWILGNFIGFSANPGTIGVDTVTFRFGDMDGVFTLFDTLITLQLRVKDDALDGDAEIALSITTIADADTTPISSYNNIPGKVEVVSVVAFECVECQTYPCENCVDGLCKNLCCAICNPILPCDCSACRGFGDVDCDGAITSADVTFLRRYIAATDKQEFLKRNPSFNPLNANVTGKWETDEYGRPLLAADDVTLLRRWIAAPAGGKPRLGPSLP
jgi:hypothetical protein